MSATAGILRLREYIWDSFIGFRWDVSVEDRRRIVKCCIQVNRCPLRYILRSVHDVDKDTSSHRWSFEFRPITGYVSFNASCMLCLNLKICCTAHSQPHSQSSAQYIRWARGVSYSLSLTTTIDPNRNAYELSGRSTLASDDVRHGRSILVMRRRERGWNGGRPRGLDASPRLR